MNLMIFQVTNKTTQRRQKIVKWIKVTDQYNISSTGEQGEIYIQILDSFQVSFCNRYKGNNLQTILSISGLIEWVSVDIVGNKGSHYGSKKDPWDGTELQVSL
jgi:hypothetical protein